MKLHLFVSLSIATCPYEHIRIVGQYRTVSVFTINQNNRGGGVVHCSNVWPNEEPEFAIYPNPPGCLFINVDESIAPNNVLKTDLGQQGGYLYFQSEHDWPEFKIASFPVKCESVISRTNFAKKSVIIGENCYYPGTETGCASPKVAGTHTSTCVLSESPDFAFGEATGWHRTLTGTIPEDVKGYAWLPPSMFADPDELSRQSNGRKHTHVDTHEHAHEHGHEHAHTHVDKHTHAHTHKHSRRNKSVSRRVNIENPTVESPRQIVVVGRYPLPVHARVNPPTAGKTHTMVQIPEPVYATRADACWVEKLEIASLIGVPIEHRLTFMKNRALIRTGKKLQHYAITKIPCGNPDDLLIAVVTTALSATIGALAIVIASKR